MCFNPQGGKKIAENIWNRVLKSMLQSLGLIVWDQNNTTLSTLLLFAGHIFSLSSIVSSLTEVLALTSSHSCSG